MITFAIPSDLPALRALWRECFGDPEFYAREGLEMMKQAL